MWMRSSFLYLVHQCITPRLDHTIFFLQVCTRYIKPLCSAYWEEGWKTLTARPVQEALVWHERMLRARAHAAERGFGRGMLDAVLGGRAAEVSKPAVDVKWASIWTLSDASGTSGGIQKRTRKPIFNNLVNCLLALGSFQVPYISN